MKAATGLCDMRLHKCCRFFFCVTTDLTNHENGFGLVVRFVHLQQIDKRSSNDWVTTQANAGRLPETGASGLPNGFISQRTAAAHDADLARLVDIAWHNADLAFTRVIKPGQLGPINTELLALARL